MSSFNEEELIQILSKKSGLTIDEIKRYCDAEIDFMKEIGLVGNKKEQLFDEDKLIQYISTKIQLNSNIVRKLYEIENKYMQQCGLVKTDSVDAEIKHLKKIKHPLCKHISLLKRAEFYKKYLKPLDVSWEYVKKSKHNFVYFTNRIREYELYIKQYNINFSTYLYIDENIRKLILDYCKNYKDYTDLELFEIFKSKYNSYKDIELKDLNLVPRIYLKLQYFYINMQRLFIDEEYCNMFNSKLNASEINEVKYVVSKIKEMYIKNRIEKKDSFETYAQNLSLKDLNFLPKHYHMLKINKITNLSELIKLKEDDMYKLKFFREEIIDVIKNKIQEEKDNWTKFNKS